MAMELQVFSDHRLNSTAEWQHAIDAQNFALRLAGDVHFASTSGFLPAMLEGNQTGFECFHDDAWEAMRFLGVGNFDHLWKYALGFRWRGDFSELEAAWMAATAYAAITKGIIFDHEEGRVFTPQQGRELVAKFVSERPQVKAFLEEVKRKFSIKP
ncbi:MAG: hypothetical protein WBG10_03450 [Pseudolabrys sp.]